jgi:hypothetical protein
MQGEFVSDFALVQYRPELKGVWDEVVKRAKNGNFLHLRDYLDYHAHRFDEQSVIVESKGGAVAVFPCNRVEHQIISHGGLTYCGLIYGTDLHAAEILEIFGLLAGHYKMLGATTLRYKAIPHIFHRYPAEEDLYALFRFGARLVRRDISSAIAMENRIKLSDSRRCTMRKAGKNGVEIVEGRFLKDFHELLISVLAKSSSTPVHSLAELELLLDRFPEQIRLFGAFKEGRLLAGALVYDFGTVAHTQYLASSDEGRALGALDFALAYLLEQVFVARRYCSFGISTEQEGRYLNEGLIFQKEGFGGRGVVHDFYELDL